MTDAEIRRALRLVIQGAYVPEKKELKELFDAVWRLYFYKIQDIKYDAIPPESWSGKYT